MAKNSRPTSQKRAREKARIDRQKEKEARRVETRQRKANASPSDTAGIDPDIAGITPGPQPRPDWLEDLENEKDAEDEEESAEAK